MKKVISYRVISTVNRFGDTRIGYVPVFKDYGTIERTTLESIVPNLPRKDVFAASDDIWERLGKERG